MEYIKNQPDESWIRYAWKMLTVLMVILVILTFNLILDNAGSKYCYMLQQIYATEY